MKCIVCGKPGPDKRTREATQWDWFTGYLSETAHFCPEHKRSRMHDQLLAMSRKQPLSGPQRIDVQEAIRFLSASGGDRE